MKLTPIMPGILLNPFVATLFLILWLNQSWASVSAVQACDQAAIIAAQKTGVPVSVLQAVTRIETGRSRNGETKPWPWTVNMEGKGVWFSTEDQARAFVYKNYKRGARSFDIGCFQINYKWHGQEFASIEDMFDPTINALYAAKFLLALFNEKGSWDKAAGAFHSRTEKHASKYEKRFISARQRLTGTVVPKNTTVASVEPDTQAPQTNPQKPLRINNFPLLRTGKPPAMLGSLVPLDSTQKAGWIIPIGRADG